MNISSLALFCGSAKGKDQKYTDLAEEFGERCARQNITLIYGGGCIGLMGVAATAVLAHEGTVIGIAPDLFNGSTILLENVTQMQIVSSMSERKQQFEKLADAFVVLPGSYGTMDELFEVITDAQLGLHSKPVVLLNAFGYYDHLISLLKHFRDEGFLASTHFDLLLVADTVEALFQKLDSFIPQNAQNWKEKLI